MNEQIIIICICISIIVGIVLGIYIFNEAKVGNNIPFFILIIILILFPLCMFLRYILGV